jgi:hypothetical protein
MIHQLFLTTIFKRVNRCVACVTPKYPIFYVLCVLTTNFTFEFELTLRNRIKMDEERFRKLIDENVSGLTKKILLMDEIIHQLQARVKSLENQPRHRDSPNDVTTEYLYTPVCSLAEFKNFLIDTASRALLAASESHLFAEIIMIRYVNRLLLIMKSKEILL